MKPSELETWRSGQLGQIDEEISRLKTLSRDKQAQLDADVAKQIDLIYDSLQARLSDDLKAIWVKIEHLESRRQDVELADEMPASPAAPPPAPAAIKASKQRKKKAAENDGEAADQAFEAEADALYDEMVAEPGLSEAALNKSVSLGFLFQN